MPVADALGVELRGELPLAARDSPRIAAASGCASSSTMRRTSGSFECAASQLQQLKHDVAASEAAFGEKRGVAISSRLVAAGVLAT